MVQICGVALHSEGWPVCLHEKVVVQLSPLDQEPFHRSDVYLPDFPSVTPSPKAISTTSCWAVASSKPPLLLCSILSNGLHVAKQKESEIALCFLFSMAWLESVNREQERQKGRRERCLLSGHGDVFRVPWEDLVYPQFISLAHGPKDKKDSSGKDRDGLINTSAVPNRESDSFHNDVKLLPFSKKSDQSLKSNEEEKTEGEYVPLPSFSPQKGSLTQSLSLQVKVRTSPHAPQNTDVHISGARHSSWSGSKINSQTSASPPAHSEVRGDSCCQEKSWMFAKESGGNDSDCKEQQKNDMIEEQVQEPVEERDTAGERNESDGEETDEDELAEVVEIEEEVQVIIQPNRDRLQEDELMIEDKRKAESQDVDSCANMCSDGSFCEKNTDQTESVDSYSEKEKTVLGPPSPGTKEGFKSQQKEEQNGGVDVKGATEINSEAASLLADPSLKEPEAAQCTQTRQTSLYTVLLRSGAVCLPGSRDRGGRALLTISARSSVWSDPDCDEAELLRLLLYYRSTLREEVQVLGLTVLVDARGTTPLPIIFSALRSLHKTTPGAVHRVLLLVNKDPSLHVEKPGGTQVEVLHSLQSLHTRVDLQQVPAHLGGSLTFSQNHWLYFRLRVEQLSSQCKNVIQLLQETITVLQATPLPAEAQEAELLLAKYKMVMCSILEDSRLVQLQQEGGASLSWLRGVSVVEEERAAVEKVSTLYNEVDELLHSLVTLSNCKTQELSFIQGFGRLEQAFSEMTLWLQQIGEVQLQAFEEHEDSLALLIKKQLNFKDFYTTAYGHCSRGEELLRSLDCWSDLSTVGLQAYEVRIQEFWTRLQDFSQRVQSTGGNIDRSVRLYRFLDQAYGWALEGLRHLAGISMEDCTQPDRCQAAITSLEEYQQLHPPIPDSCFQEMKAEATELQGEQGLRQWKFAWSKCQETKKVFDRKMEAALRTQHSASRRRSVSALSKKTLSELWGERDTCCPLEEISNTTTPPSSSLLHSTSTPALTSSSGTPQHTPLLQRLFRSSSKEEKVGVCSSVSSIPRLNSTSSSTRRQMLRKTQSFDCPSTTEGVTCGPCPRTVSAPVRRGHTGVFIRGLEVSSTEVTDRSLSPRLSSSHGWSGVGQQSPRTPNSSRCSSSPAAPQHKGGKLRHIVEEMVTTEREYVRSLHYIIHHYFPEMERADLPQDLRGKRSVVFGNLEKLLEFHSQFFLKELESCWKHPLRAPHCFLRHQEQFDLYALYSKNKPKSDALLASHGTEFFRKKQMELGDKMDLSSYLLKPVQRMSKYALLLTDLMKEVSASQEAELSTLQDATSMVKFQLRHGNDLLAMDAIRDCDVNLKEQGQLIRQDEFTIWTGRRKSQRHVFLFEELVLFSKPKKMEGGLDVFIYKQSFKTADVGLTESTGNNGLQFEVWFRRRRSKSNTFILQAPTEEVKNTWTTDIARILWAQATRNKELRLKELVSMGVGNKPFLDIQPSDAAISDRAVHCIMKSRGARTRASIAVSAFDHSGPFKQGALSSGSAPSPLSSSSLLGPLNLHLYRSMSSSAADSSFITSFAEDDEQEHETSSQPSMTTESSGSSSRCLSGSTGSDSGCVSSHLQEAPHDELSPPCQHTCCSTNKHHLRTQNPSPTAAAMISPASVV
ncbi:puratrophin-1 isoform X2 [Takifugu rubripes]|uniref:puratrophin-1 isoform X2 n=1 Tax=Takifugu rubripes TaxID=31033 RepID=UPI001145B209|nr:puratrophin-1-like isoform X2 [Takifugu rubripes]